MVFRQTYFHFSFNWFVYWIKLLATKLWNQPNNHVLQPDLHDSLFKMDIGNKILDHNLLNQPANQCFRTGTRTGSDIQEQPFPVIFWREELSWPCWWSTRSNPWPEPGSWLLPSSWFLLTPGQTPWRPWPYKIRIKTDNITAHNYHGFGSVLNQVVWNL